METGIACPGNSEHGDKINETDVFQYERIVPESLWKYFRGSTHGGNPNFSTVGFSG